MDKWKVIAYIAVAAVIWLLGFLIGRSTTAVRAETVVEYVKGDTVRDSIPYPVPYVVYKPTDTAGIIRQCVKDGIYTELFPARTITEVEYIEVTKADTSQMLTDWATLRKYQETLFDIDTTGKCLVDAEVQYNRLRLVGYTYTPVHKVVTIKEQRVRQLSPFLGLGLGLVHAKPDMHYYPTVECGFFVRERVGVDVRFGRDFANRTNLYGVSLLYKFR